MILAQTIQWQNLAGGRASYTLFMVIAFVAFFIARRFQPKWLAPKHLSWRNNVVLLMSAFVGGAFGAKLGAIAELASRESLALDWHLFFSDGKTITTGIAGAYLAVEFSKWMIGVRAKTGDAWALPMAVGMSVGRLGCFFNGCCYGAITRVPWAIDFSPVATGLRHPTQLYESIFHLVSAIILVVLIRRRMFRHHLLKFYLIAYFTFRFFTEFIRPADDYLGGLTFYQWVAILFSLFLIAQWYYDARAMRPGPAAPAEMI